MGLPSTSDGPRAALAKTLRKDSGGGEGVTALCFHSGESQNIRKGMADSREEGVGGEERVVEEGEEENCEAKGRTGRELLEDDEAPNLKGLCAFDWEVVGIGGDVVKEGNGGRLKEGGEVEGREGEEASTGEGEEIWPGIEEEEEDGKVEEEEEDWRGGKGEGDIGDIGKGKEESRGD